MRRFGRDPHIIGRVLNLSPEPYRVIGVLPPDVYPLRMSNPAEKPDIFMPLGFDAREANTCRSCFGGSAIGRIKPGVSVDQARAELNGIMRGIGRDYPVRLWLATPPYCVEPLRDHLVGPIQTALWVLLGAVALLLADRVCQHCESAAGARDSSYQRDEIRAALGASRWRLAAQLLTESLSSYR